MLKLREGVLGEDECILNCNGCTSTQKKFVDLTKQADFYLTFALTSTITVRKYALKCMHSLLCTCISWQLAILLALPPTFVLAHQIFQNVLRLLSFPPLLSLLALFRRVRLCASQFHFPFPSFQAKLYV